MIAKVIQREEGRVVVSFEAETPAEGMTLGLVATDQPHQRTSLSTYSSTFDSDNKPPRMIVTLGAVALRTVEMVQGR